MNLGAGGARVRFVAACALAIFSLLAVASPARAVQLLWPVWPMYTSSSAIAHGWAWQVQRAAAPSLGAVSGIPSGDFAVAWLGEPDKVAYLDIGGAGSGSLDGAVLRLRIDSAGPNVSPEAAQLSACLIVLDWVPAEPMPWDTKPPTVCNAPVFGRYDAASATLSFDLTPLADGLASAAVHGLSIEPVEMPASSFQVVFKPEIELRLATRAPEAESVTPPLDTEPAQAPVGPSMSGDNMYSPPSAVSGAASDRAGQSALPVTGQRRDNERPVSLTGVYAMLIVLAGLVLGGRVLAALLRSRREDER